VLERHRGNAAAIVGAAHEAHETRKRSDIRAATGEDLELAPDIEIRFLDADDRHG
jgi:hypothetical protein